MKGLVVFIADIRYCASKEAEERRVEKELAKIRAKFSSANASNLSGYDKKKYVWKLLYCFMLGYEIDFGHIMAINLCSRPKYSEKNAGYLACSLLLMENHEILRLIVNIAKQDIQNDDEHIVALSLNTVANIGGQEFTENLFQDISKMLSPQSSASAYIKRKACVCLLRLFRRDTDSIVSSVWSKRLATILTSSKDIGFLLSCAGLVIGILEQGDHPITEWQSLVSATVHCLTNVVHDAQPSHVYYSIPAPWLQIKLLRILQFFPPALYDNYSLKQCNELLDKQLNSQSSTTSAPTSCDKKKIDLRVRKHTKENAEKLNRANVEHSVLFEAMNLVVHLDTMCDQDNLKHATNLLGGFVSSKEANIRYLGLETMARLAHGESFKKGQAENLERYKNLILAQMQEADISIRRQALNLLYAVCDRGNWQQIVDELLEVLSRNDQSLQEELVLKIAILSERFAPDFTWYIDVVFKMLEYAPSSVEEDVWYRVVQVVTGFEDRKTPDHQDLQKYAADKAYTMLKDFDHPHETMVKLCGYLLGEFGHVLDISAVKLFSVLHKHFQQVQCSKPIILSAYAKLLNSNPELRSRIFPVFEDYNDSIDPETQQRCCEYIKLEATTAGEQVLAMMPPFPDRDNPLIRRLKKDKGGRAQTRQELEEAAKSEGGIYKVGSMPSGSRSLFDTPLEEDVVVRNAQVSKGKDTKKKTKSASSSSSAESSSDESSSGAEEPAKPPKQLWSDLCVKTQGQLYVSSHLNIQLKHEYQKSRGRLAIQLKNLTDETIKDLRITIPDVSALKIQSSEVPTKLEPKEAAMQYLQVDCIEPFLQPAKYLVQFRIGTQSPIQLPLTLPIIMTKFMTPADMPYSQMVQYFGGMQHEQQITSEMRVPASQWPEILKALRQHPREEAGSPITMCASTFNSETQQIAVVTKLEQAQKQGRITVRSTLLPVSQTLAQIAASYLFLPPK